MKRIGMLTLAAVTCLAGCSFAARSADMYRRDTRELLMTRKGQLKSCYDAAHKQDKTVAGTVVTAFTLEPDTGKVLDPKVVEAETTAPKPLQDCVLQALDGLVLEPGDARKGEAQFAWKFEEK